ncbi:MAG TPA: glycoside hydrolase family 9 protein [Polyangiaceae bacterium]
MTKRRHALGIAGFIALAFAMACGSSSNKSAPSKTGPAGADGAAPEGDAAGVSAGDDAAGTTTPEGTPDGSGVAPVDAGPIVAPQPLSPDIVVDQFGYLPASEKIAIVRNPQVGFDKATTFTPGATYALVDAHSSKKLLEAAPAVWNGGATDSSSGDKVWWFDFSSVTTPGDYFVLDETASVRSAVFTLSTNVYRTVLVQSTRMYYYQRDGIAKDAKYAGAEWADGVAHPQDSKCGLYSDGSAPQDLHGGWFDAGDQNRYTNWGASDVIELLRAYVENPAVFTDDTNIPESGNGVADLLDEAKWELDWMARMQQSSGSVLSIAGHAGASPPSTDTSPCRYGPASTSATLTSAAAFAYASIVFGTASGAATAYPGYAAGLKTRAQNAWTWAVANPSVKFFNAQNGVGSGEQEVSDATSLLQKKLQAAVFLFELTGTATYQTFFDGNDSSLLSSFDPFHMDPIDTALEYARTKGATASVAQTITSGFKSNVEGANYFGVLSSKKGAYPSYLQTYTWGSNQTQAGQGNMFADVAAFGIDAAASAQATTYAERYVHYFNGVNPIQLVYLSNMGAFGAESSVTRFFHTWFAHGSDWDAAGVSKYGPPPGYLTGGPNPSYTWDSCCPSNCSGNSCGAAPLSPPTGQPDQKSYRDFNDSWPLDSWQVTEPDDGYQAQYVRLLSKFVQ